MKKQILLLMVLFFPTITGVYAGSNIINVKKTGSGSPMILIHGMACSDGVWDDIADRYKDKFELHIVSINGFGNSATIEAPHILEAIRNAIVDYVRTQGLEKPILMGHSMGGFLSLWAAAEHEEMFSSIISIDGLPYFPVLAMPGITPESAATMVEHMNTGMQNQDPETARANQQMIIGSMVANESKRERLVEMGLASNPQVIGKALGEMFTTDLRDQVKGITIPVLVFGSWYGYKNYGATKESSLNGYLLQFESIESAEVHMAETALHFIFYDEPEWFFEVVDQFLAKTAGM